MEDIQTKVSVSDRTVELSVLVKSDHAVTSLRNAIAILLEQAYIAGANSYTVGEQPIRGLNDTGSVSIAATNYSKDKGFKI